MLFKSEQVVSMKFLLAALVCLSAVSPARGQDIHGTVVVSGHSKTKLVLATESRNADAPSSDMCKILVLDSRTVFAGAGIAGHAKYWNAYAEVAYAFEKAKPSQGSSQLRNTATDFGDRFSRAVNKALKIDRDASKRLIEDEENRVFNALFLGFTEGVAEIYQIQVIYDPLTDKASASLDTFVQEDDLRFGAGGRNETVVEVISGASEFGRSELKKWEKMQKEFPQQDRDVRWAMKLVELTIGYNPHREDVGGPIDGLEITRDGIRWVQCKPKCQCNNKPLIIPPNVRKILESE